CKKDDENTVPGQFTFDGKKHELQSCYFAKNAEFGPLYRLVMIVSKDITFTNTFSSVTGKGNIVLLGIQLPEGQTDFSSGDYTYESDPAYRLPSTFNGGFMVGFDSANGNSESESEMSNTTILKITKSGQNYTFSASGVTEDGKIFDFLYTGSLIQLQDYK
ncbi:MAG: hypothetical protein ACOYN4_14045, partial [Bacteroidales bacterium]